MVRSLFGAAFKTTSAYFLINLEELIGYGLFQRCLKFSAQDSCAEETAKDVEHFFCRKIDSTPLATLDRPIKQVAEHIRNNVKFLAFSAPQVDEYLKKKAD